MTLEEVRVVSEIFSNYAMPIATFMAAVVVVWGAKEVTEKVVEARGAGSTVQSQAPTGLATGGRPSTSSNTSAPQGSAGPIANK
jgi:hypothetical protein